MSQAKVIIRKYENRRLYDTAASRYVNLDDVAELIRRGADVQVVDAKTGEDITRVTLTQIIMDDAREQPTGLPLELLRQLIVASDQARHEFIMWYLKTAFDTYQQVQEAVQSRLSDVRSAALTPFEMMKSFFQGPRPSPPSPESPGELEELRHRVAELEGRLATQAAPRKRRKGKKT